MDFLKRYFISRITIRGALLAILLIVLIPMLLAQVGIYYQWFITRWTEEIRANGEMARVMGLSFEEFIRDVYDKEQELGRVLASLESLSGPEVNKLLYQSVGKNPFIRTFGWVSPKGRIIADNDSRAVGVELQDRTYFREVISGKAWSISDLTTSRVDESPIFVVASGIHDARGHLQGVMIAKIDPASLVLLPGTSERSKGDVVSLYDRNGTLIYSRPKSLLAVADRRLLKQDSLLSMALTGKVSSGIFTSPVDGRKRIASLVPIGNTGWVAGASRPVREVLYPIYKNLLEVLGLTSGVVVLSVLVARGITRKITLPMTELQEYALALGRGEFGRWKNSEPWINELNELGKVFRRMAGQLQERKQALLAANEELESRVRERTTELARSNEELERFAYVASHDLQEPLRMVASFVELLEKRYHDKVDDEGREFIAFAVEGAVRMQNLIRALLKYSQVSRDPWELGEVDCESVFRQILSNLKITMEENRAHVTADPLPRVMGDETQLIQLFQNLIENAIKFRSIAAPVVHVSISQKGTEWVFGVHDNGIGIEPEFFDRIFIIFQRLHSRRKYSGTGIGLAICKRVVERHGGRIWVESSPGTGSTFYFTIPVKTESFSDTRNSCLASGHF